MILFVGLSLLFYCAMPNFTDPSFVVFQALQNACSPGNELPVRAMARNLLAEHRVSGQRFLGFLSAAGELASIDQVREALEDYQWKEVRPFLKNGTPPAYVRTENANNMAALNADTRLGTVLDLTRLGRVYAEAKSFFKLPEFSTYEVTDPRDRTQINEFLAIRLEDPARRETFLRAIFKVMARYRLQVEDRVLPTWAAEWKSLEPFLHRDSPRAWLQAVGVPRDHPVWLVVLRYPVRNRDREVRLFRPTQLDAGWYAHHFPSPPQADIAKGGHTMFLSQNHTSEVSGPPVSEFLHEQIDFGIGDWIAGGSLFGFTGLPSQGALDDQRRQHLSLLQTLYGQGVHTWMPECN